MSHSLLYFCSPCQQTLVAVQFNTCRQFSFNSLLCHLARSIYSFFYCCLSSNWSTEQSYFSLKVLDFKAMAVICFFCFLKKNILKMWEYEQQQTFFCTASFKVNLFFVLSQRDRLLNWFWHWPPLMNIHGEWINSCNSNFEVNSSTPCKQNINSRKLIVLVILI